MAYWHAVIAYKTKYIFQIQVPTLDCTHVLETGDCTAWNACVSYRYLYTCAGTDKDTSEIPIQEQYKTIDNTLLTL